MSEVESLRYLIVDRDRRWLCTAGHHVVLKVGEGTRGQPCPVPMSPDGRILINARYDGSEATCDAPIAPYGAIWEADELREDIAKLLVELEEAKRPKFECPPPPRPEAVTMTDGTEMGLLFVGWLGGADSDEPYLLLDFNLEGDAPPVYRLVPR